MLKDFFDLKLAIVEWAGILAEWSPEKKKDRIFLSTDKLPYYDKIPKPFLQVKIDDVDEISVSHEILDDYNGNKAKIRMPYKAVVTIITHGSLLTSDGVYVTAQDLLERMRFNYADTGEILNLSNFYDKYLGHIFFLGGMTKSLDTSYPVNDEYFARFEASINIEYWITKEKDVDKLTKIHQPLINFKS